MENVLNEKEIQVLLACINEVMACTNGEYGYTGDVKLPKEFRKKQKSGYLSQLSRKGYIQIYDEYNQFKISISAKPYIPNGINIDFCDY